MKGRSVVMHWIKGMLKEGGPVRCHKIWACLYTDEEYKRIRKKVEYVRRRDELQSSVPENIRIKFIVHNRVEGLTLYKMMDSVIFLV